MNKLLIILSLSTLVMSSCEKVVNINLDSAEKKIAIDAHISRTVDPVTGQEMGQPPIVILTKSLSFTSSIDSATLAELFIHDAEVTVSNGITTTVLREYSVDSLNIPNVGNAYFYSLDTAADPSTFLFGEFNQTYNLTIKWNGQTYTAQSTLYAPRPIDSFWVVDSNVPNVDTPFLDLKYRYTDPIAKGDCNYYKVNSTFASGKTSEYDDYFNDEVTNGVSLSLILRSSYENEVQRGHFVEGDSVHLEWSSIDYSAFQFFNTKNFNESAIGNPFATPVQIKGNISNGGLGAFIAYGTLLYNIKISK